MLSIPRYCFQKHSYVVL